MLWCNVICYLGQGSMETLTVITSMSLTLSSVLWFCVYNVYHYVMHVARDF